MKRIEKKALQVRFPAALYNLLKERSEKSRRSLNAEIVFSLEKYIEKKTEDGK